MTLRVSLRPNFLALGCLSWQQHQTSGEEVDAVIYGCTQGPKAE